MEPDNEDRLHSAAQAGLMVKQLLQSMTNGPAEGLYALGLAAAWVMRDNLQDDTPSNRERIREIFRQQVEHLMDNEDLWRRVS